MNDSGTWTIGELAERAAIALGAGQAAPRNGRIRDVPNERLIRWYVTIGLMDPPLGRRGRIALYGPRHLLQLVAVKRRQADGRSLADIQAELTGATDATLRTIARLPEPDAGTTASPADGGETGRETGRETGGQTGGQTGHSARPPNRERFWAIRPSAAAPAAAPAAAAPGAATRATRATRPYVPTRHR
jgi:DNA-binding transcriptional MerR regulator